MPEFGLIVTDASPLVTLGAADALDTLKRPGLPVVLPDIVFLEVTRDPTKPGAQAVIDWVLENKDLVRVLPTTIGVEYQQLLVVNPGAKSKGRGERAAVELASEYLERDPTMHAVLIYEDQWVRDTRFVGGGTIADRVHVVTTGDFLRELEAARLIQSADHILDDAANAGRNVDQQRAGQGRQAGESPAGELATFLKTRVPGLMDAARDTGRTTGLLDTTSQSLLKETGTPDADHRALDRPRGRSR